MNKKERLAGAVLVLTLAVGILVDILDRGDNAARVVETGPEVRCVVEEDTSGEGLGATPGPTGRVARSTAPLSESGQVGGSPRWGDGQYRRIDLNTATLEELELLPGLGPKKAGAVIAWREEHGRFESVDALARVKGIGKITLERLAPYVCVGK
jgi:competence ComEA-like helix-hairpin-helix protein